MTLRLRNVHWTPLKQISDVVSKWWMPSSSQDYSSGICICACMYVCVHSSDMCETSSLTRFLSGYRSYFWRLNYFTHPFFSHIFLDNFHSWAEMSTMKAVFLGLKNSCILHILFRRCGLISHFINILKMLFLWKIHYVSFVFFYLEYKLLKL